MYCTGQDMIDRFGEAELLDATDRGRTGSIDYDVFDQAARDAAADINVALRGRYTVPASRSPELTRIACDLTRYYLWSIDAPEHVTERYKAATAALRDIAKGIITLDLEKPAGTTTAPQAPAVVAPEQVFTAEAINRVDLSG